VGNRAVEGYIVVRTQCAGTVTPDSFCIASVALGVFACAMTMAVAVVNHARAQPRSEVRPGRPRPRSGELCIVREPAPRASCRRVADEGLTLSVAAAVGMGH
jgi:hypothetical protein